MERSELLKLFESYSAWYPDGKLNASFPKFLRNRLELANLLTELIPEGESISEKLYRLKDLPITGCEVCGKPTLFRSYGEGFERFCSKECRNKSRISKGPKLRGAANPETLEKMKKTCLEKFGVDNRLKLRNYEKPTDNNLEKRKETMLKRYGVEHALQNIEVQAKLQKTVQNRYGVANVLASKAVRYKIQQAKKLEYWKERIEGIISKNAARPAFSFEEYVGTISESGKVIYYQWICNTCGSYYYDYIANGKFPRCPVCNKNTLTHGVLQTEFTEWFLKEFPDKAVEIDTRRIITPLELDIYLPDEKLAIEFDEAYWHSELAGGRGSEYHLNKTTLCENKDIQLFHVLDIEWLQKQEIVKSLIRAKLGKYEKKLNAREGKVIEINTVDYLKFLEENHIQGGAKASIRRGLYLNEKLVSVIGISKNRFKANSWELVRFVSLKNCLVRGAFSKLFKYATQNLKGELYSYADRRWFKGACSSTAAMAVSHINPPSFHYTRDYKTLVNRVVYQKHLLKAKLERYDENLTEWENMQLNGWDRIWDCGTIAWKITL